MKKRNGKPRKGEAMITDKFIDSLGMEKDKAGCFYEVARMGGDTFTAFCNAVDGE